MVMIIFLSFLFGLSLKLTDLLVDHGASFFKYDRLVFGLAQGIIGSTLVVVDTSVGTMILAYFLGCILRVKIDHWTHALGAVGTLITFVMLGQLNLVVFWTAFPTFLAFGLLKDFRGWDIDVKSEKHLVYKGEPTWYKYIPHAIVAFYIDELQYLFSLLSIGVSYNFVKYYFYRWGVYKEL